MSDCAKCGACTVVCPVLRISGRESHSARGKLHLLDVLPLAGAGTEFVDIFSACLLCGACTDICPRGIDVASELVAARNAFGTTAGPHGYEKYLVRKSLAYPASLASLRALGRGGEKLLGKRLPADSGLRLRLALFDEDGLTLPPAESRSPVEEGGESLAWFPGCAARYLFPTTYSACRSLLASRSCTLKVPEALSCCGLADWAAGDSHGAVKKTKQNIVSLEGTTGPILVSCASCFSQLQKYPKLFPPGDRWRLRAQQVAGRLVEFSDFLNSRSRAGLPRTDRGEEKLRVFYHDPCHMRFGATGVDQARELLQTEGVEILELEDGPRCCGQGGLFHVAHPEISSRIRDQLVADVLELRPDVVSSTCTGCLMQWQQGLAAAGSRVKVLHLAQVLEELSVPTQGHRCSILDSAE